MLLVALVRIDNWELFFELVEHFVVFDLEGAHDILASDYQVHDTRYHHPLAKLATLITDGNDIDELHESEELLMTFRIGLEELELELVLEIGKGLIHVLVPPFHEPLRPFEMRLELVEVPPKKLADFVFLPNDLVDSDGVIGALREGLDMRWINLFVLGSHVETGDANELEVLGLDVLLASLKVSIDVLQAEMEGLPFQAVVGRDLANPVE